MGENPESNRGPLVPQTNALPIELFSPYFLYIYYINKRFRGVEPLPTRAEILCSTN
jgi:hypothetical protein